MPPKFSPPEIVDLYNALLRCEPTGRELTGVLDRRNTQVRFAPIRGGFTLNVLNTIFLQPLPSNDNTDDFNFWVTLLAHEACHVEQGFIVDSVQQEVRAYMAQCRVAQELGWTNNFIDSLQQICQNVDVVQAEQLNSARLAIDELLGNQPATMLYKALPTLQPSGLAAVVAAAIELRALAGTLFIKKA